MSIISALRDYLITCPLFDKIPITVDYLSPSPTEGAIEATPVPHVIKHYTDGGRLCRYQFVIAMRFPWFGDEKEGLRCSEWFENLVRWFDKATNDGHLPQLPEGLTAVAITALPNRFGFDGKNSSARYQMICGLTFLDMKG